MSSAGSPHGPPHVQHLQRASDTSIQTIAAYCVLLIILYYYLLHHFDYTDLPLSELLWNTVVYFTPSRLVSKLDRGFETSMAGEPEDDNTGFDSKGHASKSNAMRRILGLDGGGFVTTVQRTRTFSNLSSVFKPTPKNTLPGLGNWDNSCYQNSVLQGLAALESLKDFLNDITQTDVSQPTKTALRDLITKLNDPENVGKTFWTPAELKSMSSWQQQDAQEYFSKVLDELESDTAKALKKRRGSGGLEGLRLETGGVVASKTASKINQMPEELRSIIVRSPLEGLLAQRVGCQGCGYVEGLSLVPFNCLTVPLGRSRLYDVCACLDDYTALEPITGVECAKCTLLGAKQQMEQLISHLHPSSNDPLTTSENISRALREPLQERLELITQALEAEDFSEQALKKCQIPPKNRVSTTKSRQAVIARPPKSLVVHVNRSNFDELTGIQSKNLANVRFPQKLDLALWCLGHGSGHEEKDDGIERWNVDPSKSMLSEDDDVKKLEPGKMYELRAVVTHYGRHENGHYTCYRKAPYTTKLNEKTAEENIDGWWRLSDEDVSEVSVESVLAQGGVFMLFYDQVASTTHSKNEQAESPVQLAKEVTASTADGVTGTILTDALPELLTSFSDSQVQPLLEQQPPTNPYPTPPLSPFGAEEELKDEPAGEGGITVLRSNASPPVAPEPRQEPIYTAAGSTAVSPSPSLQHSHTVKPHFPKPNDHSNELVEQAPLTPTQSKENQPVSPASMRTAAPCGGRGSVSRAGKAMGSMAGFVQAN